MRCLILVIVSFDKPVYYDMLRLWRERCLNNSFYDVWFIQCKPACEWIGDIVNDLPLLKQSRTQSLSQSLSQSQRDCLELDHENKTLFVKGDECLIPGILYKTVEALSFFLSADSSYDFIWRTNLSSVLDFAGLQRYIETISSSKRFYGGYIGLGSLNNGSSTFFASGAGFLMSRDVGEYLVENKQFLRWDLIDDVAIGALLEPVFAIVPIDRCWVQTGSEDISALVANGIFHFRCESYQHSRTVEFMQYVSHFFCVS